MRFANIQEVGVRHVMPPPFPVASGPQRENLVARSHITSGPHVIEIGKRARLIANARDEFARTKSRRAVDGEDIAVPAQDRECHRAHSYG